MESINIHTNKYIFILLMLFLSLYLCACGSDDNKDNIFNNALHELNNSQNTIIDSPGISVSSSENSSNPANAPSDNSSDETTTNSTEPNSTSDTPEDNINPVIIVLDPGHGGIFAGANFNGYHEEILTLKVAMYARTYLLDNYKNVEVYLTRESNTELSKDLVEELEMRAIFAKEKKADALVSLHFNASEKHDVNGATVYISRRPNVHDTANELAESILQELLSLGLKRQGVLMRKSNDMFDEEGEPYDYYAINRHCANRDLVGIIVEHCFMDNSTDIKYLDTEEALKKLGEADAIGIAKYYNLVHNQ